MDRAVIADYHAYYNRRNIFVHKSWPLIRRGAVTTSDSFCTDDDVLRSEYYNDFLRPLDSFYLIGSVVADEQKWVTFISSHRSRRAGPFEREDIQLFEILAPHLQRALHLHRQFDLLRNAADSLDAANIGVVLCSSTGVAIRCNREATAILSRRDGIYLAMDGTLTCSRESASFSALIHSASMTSTGKGLGPGGVLRVERPSGRRPYSILVSPVHGNGIVGAASTTVTIFISDPDRTPSINKNALAHLYGLTPAEARLTAALVEGFDLKQACERLQIQKTTGRTHLQRILNKTGTARQSELIVLVHGSVAALRLPAGESST